jgi:hypothetical protein
MQKCMNPLKLVSLLELHFPDAQVEEPTEGKVVFRLNGGVICNIYLNTGTVYFQGKTTGKNKQIIESIENMMISINDENTDM